VKIRGIYATREDANKRAKFLLSIDPDFHVFVGELGKWLGWDPDPNTIEDQEYSDKKLQKLVTDYKKNRSKAKVMEEERKREILEESVKRETTKATRQQDRMKNKMEQNKMDRKLKEMEDDRLNPNTYKTSTQNTTQSTVSNKNDGEVDTQKVLMKSEQDRLLKKEQEIKKTVEGLSSVDDKINHLQKNV